MQLLSVCDWSALKIPLKFTDLTLYVHETSLTFAFVTWSITLLEVAIRGWSIVAMKR